MTRIFVLMALLSSGGVFGQTKKEFVGTYLLKNGLDSVCLTIDKSGSFRTVSTSICHGDYVFKSKGKWQSHADTITLITYKRTRTGQKTKKYEYKPSNSYVIRQDSLLLLDENKQFSPPFSYRKTN